MPKTPRQLPFELHRSSDVDGSPHLAVDADKADLTGWRVEMTDSRGQTTLEPFGLITASRTPDGEITLNPYNWGDTVKAWGLCVEGGAVGDVIAPDGTRY